MGKEGGQEEEGGEVEAVSIGVTHLLVVLLVLRLTWTSVHQSAAPSVNRQSISQRGNHPQDFSVLARIVSTTLRSPARSAYSRIRTAARRVRGRS